MLLLAAAVLEALAGARAFTRMATTAGGTPLARDGDVPERCVAIVMPVLNEASRLGGALAALARCGPEVEEIVVVDGGSTDATRDVVARAAAHDVRVRLVAAPRAPAGWNNKAWNIATGVARTRAPWIATVDADVRAGPRAIAAAVARARADELDALSVATRQALPDAGSALLHPALLTTLVYRFGLPNAIASDPMRVQANGQLFVARRDALERADAIAASRASRCEDVTIARALALRGGRIGFFEGDAVVTMHASWRDCAASWPRSLTLRDRFMRPPRVALELAAVTLAQALPLPTLIALLLARPPGASGTLATALAAGLVAARLGVLAGTRRAYVDPGPFYWLSPLADLPAAALLVRSALRRTHVWRGRTLVAERA
ncbi:MAG TPA: glycosyltransferase [Candidatus Elarobacter sp.]|jgi:dolichol-phosphate mannosyltransferase|nr:glycosyltransferase [Candidatus Elarobacter sp.]